MPSTTAQKKGVARWRAARIKATMYGIPIPKNPEDRSIALAELKDKISFAELQTPEGKAKALAKKHEIPIPKKVQNWPQFLKEVKAEVDFNKVMDEFKTKKDRILQKQRMKHVVEDLKNYQRNRIHLVIPVERTDPPTVSKAVIHEQLGSNQHRKLHRGILCH